MTASRCIACVRFLILICLATSAGGCQLLGVFADKSPDPTVGPKYKNLQHQQVAVMVWADRATSIDWPTLQLDLTRGIESRLRDQAQQKKPPKELEETSFVAAESVVRYQRDHPETDSQEITDVAPHMAITRLIYVELQQFSTRPEDSLELFRGSIAGNLKVVEVQNGKAKVTFEEDNIHVSYPKQGPEQGLPGRSDADMYEKTLESFSTQIMNRFVTHVEPRE
jgi:hypothetical protein